MNLIVDYDQNTSSLPSGFVNAISYVIGYFDNLFIANVTVTINVGFGEIDGQSLASDALGESEQNSVVPVSYSSVRKALIAQNAPGSSTLPAQAPAGAPSTLFMPSAEEKALGFIANNSNIDGYVGFDSTPGTFSYGIGTTPPSGQYYFVGVVEHEFTEIMGRTSYLDYKGDYSTMDLFRYSAPGVRQFTTGAASYFSVNSGTTNLNNWNNFKTGNSGDLGDWAPSAGYDAFDDNSYPGVINGLSSADLTNMAAIGWSQSSAVTQPAQPPTTGLQFVGVGEFGAGPSSALAWQTSGNIEIWSETGSGLSASLVPNAHMGSNWSAFGVFDPHNGSGSDEILWNNGNGGQITVWQLSGGNLSSVGSPNGAMGAEWAASATADFDGNGGADVVWHDQNTGQVSVWYLNGTTLSSAPIVNDTIDNSYSAVATGDFFQVGRAGVLWENTAGQLQDWFFTGGIVQQATTVGQIGTNWHVAGVGSFNGIPSSDATSDIVWVDTSNDVQIWSMSGGQIAQVVTPNGRDGTEWTLRGVGDFTDSGSSQLLWLDGKGDAQIWQINGTQVSVISTSAPAGTAAEPANDGATPAESASYTRSSGSLSFGDINDLQYVNPGETVTDPVITDGMLQLTAGAIVDGPITFAPGSTGTLFDSDQAALPDTVVGFNEGSTYLSFSGQSADTEAQVVASAQLVNGSTVLVFPDQTSIVLNGVTHVGTGIFT